MTINTNVQIPMTEADQNFSKVVCLVEDEGIAIILEDSKPRYVVMDFNEYEEIKHLREQIIEKTANDILSENMEAFKELAK